MLRIGLPAGLQSVMYSFSNLVIQASINSFGTNAVAAWTAYGKIDGIFWMTINAFGIAITTFVGQNFGAKKYARVKRSVWVCMGFAALFSVALSVLILLFGPQLYRLFTQDADVVSVGVVMMQFMVPYYITYIAIEVLSGALRGTGDAIVPMLIPAVGICVLRIVWISFVVPMFPQVQTVCISYPVSWVATSVLFFAYYAFGKWMPRGIARMEHRMQQPETAIHP